MAIATDDLKVETTDIQPCVKKLSLEIPESVVSKEYNKALEKVRKTARIQGFRQGKAPRQILEKMYSESILWDIGQKLISDGYQQALKDLNLKVFGDPSFENVNVKSGEPISFSATVEIIPEVTLPEMAGWEFERKVEAVSDEEVEGPINQTREQHAELIPADGKAVSEGDFVILDYAGKVDGKEENRLTADNTEMVISLGDMNILSEFHTEIIGLKGGDEKEFKLNLPKHFPAPDLAGKEVEFKVKLHAVKEKKLPELTDEFIAENTPYKTVEEMRAKIRENLEAHARRNGDEKLRAEIIDKMIKETGFELPPKMKEEYANIQANRLRERAKQSGMELENSPNFDKAEFDKNCLEIGEKLAREEILVGAVSEQEKVMPDQNEIFRVKNEYMQMIQRAGMDAKEGEQRALSLAIRETMAESVFKHLVSKVKISEKTVDKAKEKE